MVTKNDILTHVILTPPPSWFRFGPIRHRLHHGFRCHVPPWVIKSMVGHVRIPWFYENWGVPTKMAIPIKSYFLLAPPTFIETSRFWWKPRFWYHGRNHEKHEKWSNRALLYIYIYRIGGKREKHRFRHHDPHHWNRVPYESCGSYAECHVGTQFWNGWSDGENST